MNKLIVITGGTKGIGRAIAEKFARERFDVATCARKQADLDNMSEVWEKSYSGKVFTFLADVADSQQARAFAGFVNGLHRPVDVLVNNAGYFVAGKLSEEAEGTLEKMIHSNVYSAYYTTRGLVHSMINRKSGHIFNMCSIASFKAYPTGGSYAISKFALLGFSKGLREELKEHGIRVTAVMPGATQTASWDEANIAEERLMKAEDIADTVFSAYALSGRSVVEEIILRPQLGDI